MPTVTWRKWGEVLKGDTKYHVLQDGGLTITNVQYNDSGDYECVARTNVKRAEAFTKLVVRGKVSIKY